MHAPPHDDVESDEEGTEEEPSTVCDEAKLDEEGAKSKYRPRKRQTYAAIRKQMEFYFSDANIRKDRMMKQIVQEQEFIDLNVFLNFNKVVSLCKGTSDLQRALKESEKLELSEDMNSVRRKIPFDEAQSKSDEAVENCTIYVENVPCLVGHDWIEEVFQEYGAIAYISLPKYKRTSQNKGFAFVEYEHEEDAKRCLEVFGEMGACLPSTIEPSSLASINSYGDSQSNAPQGSQNSNLTSPPAAVVSQDLSISQSQTGSQLTVSSLTSQTTVNPLHKRHFDDDGADEGDGDNSAKRRKTTQGKDGVAADDKPETGAGISSISQPSSKKLDSQTDVPPVISQGLKKKSKRRKQKKIFERVKKQEKLEVESIQLRILPKRNWRQLRNKYLNMQRESMAQLKRQMRFQQFFNSQPNEFDLEALKTTPSVCVKVELKKPAKSVEVFKAQVELEVTPKDYPNFVRFIDYHEGALDAIIRLATFEEGIKEFIGNASKLFRRVTRFTNEETASYWKSVKVEQNLKKKELKENVRGKDKLLNRAEKLAKNHIRFDDVDNEPHNSQDAGAYAKVKPERITETDSHQHASQ